ncbi:hypothetical protein LTR64_003887 [Lithohypha guttulata]|uniref:uncharacterized protein n=1 Tax=Lithohypha guttulata TaxID=1690604 RepID=UPI002DDFBF1C|nr:hypothetical protein LTR51_006925 [Lithohypha guttulata]
MEQTAATNDLEARLDDQIAHIRAEIAKLRAQKQRLSTTLLGSSRVQKWLQTREHGFGSSSKSTAASVYEDTANGTEATSIGKRLEDAIEHLNHKNNVKVHNLAFGITAFPFTDTAPERRNADGLEALMLGVRIDLHPTTPELLHVNENTLQDPADVQATKPQNHTEERQNNEHMPSSYILLLRKLRHQNQTYLRVHWTNVPKHIDVDLHEQHYLPLPDALMDDAAVTLNHDTSTRNNNNQQAGNEHLPAEDTFEDDSGIDVTQDLEAPVQQQHVPPTMGVNAANISTNNQDLHRFTECVRDDLQSWWYRRQGIEYLRHVLGLNTSIALSSSSKTAHHNIQTLERKTNDARNMKIVWKSGAVGLLRIGYDGTIERAVVYGLGSGLQKKRLVSYSDSDSHSGSELSELESDDDRNVFRTQPRSLREGGKQSSQVRLFEVERLLMRDEQDDQVRVQNLVGRLEIINRAGLV